MTAPTAAGPAAGRGGVRSRIPELLRDRPFRGYWSGQTVSLFGDQVSMVALPLVAVLMLHAGAAEMGRLTAAGLLPSLLFSLHAGVWADRRGHRRRMMIAADLGRFLLVGSIPVVYAVGGLGLAQLYAVAFAAGTLSVLFEVGNAAVFVSLVPTERFVQGNSLVNGSRAMSYVGGTSLGGLLVQLLSAPYALVADACSYLVSAAFLARIAPVEPPVAERGRGDLWAGFRLIARSPLLRPNCAAVVTLNFFNFAFQAVFVLYATTALGISPGLLGLVLGAGAVGSVIGSVVTGRIVRRIGIGPAVVLGFAAFPAPLLLVPLASGPRSAALVLLFLAEFGSGFGVMVLDIASGSMNAAVIPHELRSRVAGATRLFNYGIRPLGALAGGWLGSVLGLRDALWIATAGAVLGVLWVLPSPVRRVRTLDGLAGG
ncbi:MFS transporter [Streptacidiphilus cavernicola]|uniref:MFS transporter n=1 Tax=Streptacidiphilus cavernicola TaxID=3342716 RepID=A0ABV6W3K5_9ACTN